MATAPPSLAMIDHWLSCDLDAWTRSVIQRHFNPAFGSPYWLRVAKDLPFDPLEITRYDELKAFGPFPREDLRTLDPTDLVPQDRPRPLAVRIWDTGGTTGDPCRIVYTDRMLTHRGLWRWWQLENEGFERGRAWLQATPSGPHVIGEGAWELVDLYASRAYAIDMDPRWVKRLIRQGNLAGAKEYTEHLIEQITGALRSQPIDYLNTTPALFQALCDRFPELVAKLGGVRLSGTHVSPDMYRGFKEALGENGIVGLTYGNTFGNSCGLAPENDGEVLPYVPTYPQVTTRVVDRSDWTVTVPYGQVGRVCLTVLQEDLFLPNILERDQGERWDPQGRWPTDGVANVRPLEITRSSPEGLY
ncbi:hypothetical protein [Saccharomonospora azurea]|uniref:hypothetical protein n=1 Tax=Saccharomonospora azurea TaxID=40988 RepID=UPI00240A3E8F|nr:hypothetical protein [Saccharomonospora azurea]